MNQDNSTPLNEAFTVTRKIPVRGEDGGQLSAAISHLQEHPGIASANVGEDRRLAVCYDASRIGFVEIEQILDGAGVERPASLLWRIKAELFRFTDENARANARVTPSCCSRPPVPSSVSKRK